MMPEVIMNSKKLYQAALFFFGALMTLFVLNNFLSFPNEAFYMSLPICWLLYHLIYRPEVLRQWFSWPNIFKSLGYFIFVLGYFYFLSSSMGWRIIFKEVFLAAYFLLAVGIVVRWVRLWVREVALNAKKIFKNKKLQTWAYAATFFVLWCLTILPYITATFTVHRPKIGDQVDPKSEYNLAYEDVRLLTKDNVRLHGWFVPFKGSDKSVVIGHGLGANKSNFLPLVHLWRNSGYNVLIFDFRGHGQSEGHTLTFGMREKYDIIASVDYLSRRKGLDPQKIVGYGVSFGAAALLHAAAEDDRIRIIVTDSSFADVEVMARKVVDALVFVPPFLRSFIANLGLAFVNLEIGFDIRAASPERVIARLHGQPVLIIHGIKDKLIPFSEAQKLYAAAQSPKDFYWINTVGHYATLVNPMYAQRINDFLSQHDEIFRFPQGDGGTKR